MSRVSEWLIFLILLLSAIFIIKGVNQKRLVLNRSQAWPEVLDLIISALQSGASISQSLSNLAVIGPKSIQSDFLKFSQSIQSGFKFESALDELKVRFQDPITDHLFESLYFASKFGSKNTIKILRELADYVSSDLAIRAEINTRFGWIKNSANLAALAPWLLFLILRTQPNANIAYQQPVGEVIMVAGVITTLLAYLWMNKIAQLPKVKRLFILQIAKNE